MRIDVDGKRRSLCGSVKRVSSWGGRLCKGMGRECERSGRVGHFPFAFVVRAVELFWDEDVAIGN